MRLEHPRSLVTGCLLLLLTINNALLTLHHEDSALLKVVKFVLYPAASAYCLWHAFKGRKPPLNSDGPRTSVLLGILSFSLGTGLTFSSVGYYNHAFKGLLLIGLYAGAAFFFLQAYWEWRHSSQKSA
jgi:hypothetical protein